VWTWRISPSFWRSLEDAIIIETYTRGTQLQTEGRSWAAHWQRAELQLSWPDTGVMPIWHEELM
jgi:hypothetical protein